MYRICKGKSGIPGGDQEKIMLNFHESWFLALEFPKGVRQFYRNSKGKERFDFSRYSKGKVTNLKDLGFFLKKVCRNPHFDFFGLAQQSLVML